MTAFDNHRTGSTQQSTALICECKHDLGHVPTCWAKLMKSSDQASLKKVMTMLDHVHHHQVDDDQTIEISCPASSNCSSEFYKALMVEAQHLQLEYKCLLPWMKGVCVSLSNLSLLEGWGLWCKWEHNPGFSALPRALWTSHKVHLW